jgi:septal ring factor EnvC (AmiA/AmiB activator)
MGYLGNHLATITTGIFAAVLTGLWPYFVDFAPILNFVFIMAVPIMWFLTLMCWLSQKSTDYAHKHAPSHSHTEKKSLSSTHTVQTTIASTQVDVSEIKQIQNELSTELNGLKESVKLKDSEIERLNQEISNLQTLVQIESLKTELANLKMLASQRKTKK